MSQTVSTTPPIQSAGIDFAFPAHYSFPPFFTLQPNLTTRASQLQSWSALVLNYCSEKHLFRLSSSHTLFNNTTLNRKFAPDDVKVLFSYMRENGRAEFVGASVQPSRSRAAGWIAGSGREDMPAASDEIYVFWRKLDEWASEMIEWVDETGHKGSVLTVWELSEGDLGRGRSWEGMPRELMRRVLAVAVKRQRAVLFGEEEGLGVKFS